MTGLLNSGRSIALAVATAWLAGCATEGVNRADVNTEIDIRYATVTGVEPVTLQSNAGKSAAVGGLWGLVAGSGGDRYSMLGGAAAGAALGGLTTKIMEGSDKAYQYSLRLTDGSATQVIIDDGKIPIDACVAVERGRTVNLRQVSSAQCGPALNHPVEQELDAAQHQEAAQCEAAKTEVLKADTQAQLDAAIKKMRVLCES